MTTKHRTLNPIHMKLSFALFFLATLLAVLPESTARGSDIGSISLAGQWQFDLPGKNGTASPPDHLTGTIRLPGTMDDAGLGPKNEEKPTLAGPYRIYNYAGAAWYQRQIEIPESWQGKRVVLFLERCRWTTTVWLDGQRIGTQDSLIAPHVYDFGTAIKPGAHQLAICVDNTVKIDLGVFVSALFGGTPGNMNGIIGRIDLTATPPVWIDDVQVYPDLDKKLARVAVTIGNATGKPGNGRLTVGGKSMPASWGLHGGHAEAIVDMSGVKPWDEFSPNLTDLTVKLGDDRRTVRFGMRKFSAKGTQFAMNGRPLFLRGTLECSVFPLTGYPPTDVASWQRIIRIIKSYGLNYIRFHSWCPPEAAFTAADIEGVMIQVEGPIANVNAGSNATRDAFVETEFQRIVDTYGNHPSFCNMTLGNEYGGTREVLTRWVGMLIEHDPRHLYSSASAYQATENRQWSESEAGRGIGGPATERDLRGVVSGDPRPTVGHEIGQWVYYPDFNEIKKYTGVLALKNYEMIRDDLERKYQLDLAPKYAEANGKLATLLYKEEIEVLLRTQGYAGFSLLDLHDYPTQGTALVGPLDALWDSKGFITPEAFRRFCGPTVPLLRIPKRTYTSDETFEATAQVAHYGPADLSDAQPAWDIRDSQGQVVASGNLPTLQLPTGKLSDLGVIRAPLGNFKTPGKFTVAVALRGTEYSNSWDIWVYPTHAGTPTVPAGVVLCDQWNDTARQALADGKKVFLMTTKLGHSLQGSMLPTFWSPVWFPSQKPDTMGLLCDPQHPALSKFPTDMYSDWQWWDILNQSRPLIMDDTPPGFRPILQVIDNFVSNHKLGVLFEARVGKGSLLFCSINLKDGLDKRPAASQLLASIYGYLNSDRFNPKSDLSPELLDQLFGPVHKLAALGARVIQADSEDPAYPASHAIDGNEATFWHTVWTPKAAPMPHYLIIDMGRELSLKGVTCLPRQDMANGRIAQCEVYCGDNPNVWGSPVATSRLPDTADLHQILFNRAAKGRYLKFVIQSEAHGDPFISLAELDIIPSTP